MLRFVALLPLSLVLVACGSSDKKPEPPEYFYAEEGKPLNLPNTPALSGAMVIPEATLPLGEYNPDLVKSPVIIELPESSAEEDEAKDEGD